MYAVVLKIQLVLLELCKNKLWERGLQIICQSSHVSTIMKNFIFLDYLRWSKKILERIKVFFLNIEKAKTCSVQYYRSIQFYTFSEKNFAQCTWKIVSFHHSTLSIPSHSTQQTTNGLNVYINDIQRRKLFYHRLRPFMPNSLLYFPLFTILQIPLLTMASCSWKMTSTDPCLTSNPLCFTAQHAWSFNIFFLFFVTIKQAATMHKGQPKDFGSGFIIVSLRFLKLSLEPRLLILFHNTTGTTIVLKTQLDIRLYWV